MKPTQEQLVKRYINLVYYYTKRWVQNPTDVDDMVQETYRKALMKYNNFNYQHDNQLKSWLLTICRNTIFDAHKLNKKTIVMDEEIENILMDTRAEVWLEEEIQREKMAELQQALLSLSSRDHDIIRLRYFDELSFSEIASILGIAEPTVKMRCYRALDKLRKELSNEN